MADLQCQDKRHHFLKMGKSNDSRLSQEISGQVKLEGSYTVNTIQRRIFSLKSIAPTNAEMEI